MGLVMTSALSISAQEQEEPKYMRSSIYTVLVNSDRQNKELDKEILSSNNIFVEGYNIFAKTEEKRQKNDTIDIPKSELPQVVFPTIAIPDQFNDHNLVERTIDFDAISAGISKEEAKKFNESAGIKKKKKSWLRKGGEFIANVGAEVLTGQSESEEYNDLNKYVDEYMPAVVNAYITQNNIAAKMLGKWFNYDASQTPKWNFGTIVDRGLYNASAEELSKAASSDFLRAALVGKGFELLNNTYLIAFNLRYRDTKADVAKYQSAANTIGVAGGGSAGFGIAQGIGGVTHKFFKIDGYTVEVDAHLFKLEWNESISTRFAEQFYNKDATIEELIESGLCKLTYFGKGHAKANDLLLSYSD